MRMPEGPEETKLQMGPMIDMVFLLIIFFMTASHMSSSKNMDDIAMPSASHGKVPKDRPDRWTVNVRTDGSVYSGQTPVTLDELRQLVATRVKTDPAMKVYLRADRTTPHKEVRLVMNAMAEAGVGDFIFGVMSDGSGEGGAE